MAEESGATTEKDRLLSDTEKEQTKLRATFLNSIGIGIMLIGVFTPIARIAFEDVTSHTGLIGQVLSLITCFLLSVILHLAATRILERLKA